MRVLIVSFPIIKLLLAILLGALVCFAAYLWAEWVENRYKEEEEK